MEREGFAIIEYLGWTRYRRVCPPEEDGLLAKGMKSIRELHIAITCGGKWVRTWFVLVIPPHLFTAGVGTFLNPACFFQKLRTKRCIFVRKWI